MARPKILIVEDEIIIARELEVRLRAMGYEVAGIASSGPEAIEHAVAAGPGLVLMDIVLKGDMDGIEAAAEIRRRCQVPIVYLTAYTDRATLERAKVTEPFGYIVKPFSERELNANIEMALYKHRAESRLRRLERWFVAAVEDAADAVIAADADGVITTFNAAAEAITDWTREQAVGRKLGDVLRLVDRANGEPVSLTGAAEGPLVRLADDTLLLDRENNAVPVDTTTTSIRDELDRPTGTVSVFRDLTGQRHGALVALTGDVALAAAQGVTLRGMLQLCAEAMVRHLNAAFARIWTLNTTADMLVLQASAGVYTHLDGAHARIPVGQLKIGKIARERRPHVTNDLADDPEIGDPEWARRERMAAFAGYPLLVDSRLVGVMAMFSRRPLTDRVTEALGAVARTVAIGVERKRLEEQLLQAQKMEALGQLAGGVAHDFNNLLTIIEGYSHLLLERAGIGDDVKEPLREIRKAGERAEALTRQLLIFSRKHIVEPEVLDLNAIVAGTESMLGRLLGEDLTLKVALAAELEPVEADAGQLEQVIVNLAVNARDAMPQGGRLTIETANVELTAAYAQDHLAVEPGRYVMLAVSDTGCGMSAEVRSHIFEPFFTTKGPGKGTGLGLATVYGIVKQSGGSIYVYSEPDQGTTFKIYLPAIRREAPGEGAQRSVAPASPGSERLLLVEDDDAVRAFTRHVLETYGYTVLEAGGPAEAIRLCAEREAAIQLLVTDVVMPEMGGRQLAERLAAIQPGLKVVYLSGYTDDAVIRHGILEEGVAFLQKPYSPAALAAKVREVLDRDG